MRLREEAGVPAACQPYLHSVVHNCGDQNHCQAESDEAVLHVLHDRGEDDQVCVERVEDGPVYVAALKRGERGTS